MTQSLRDIRAALDEHGVRPRKHLGQNFLHDANKIRMILEAAGPLNGKTILEVGSGTGVLTETLLDAGATVIAVEIDEAMVQILRDRIGPDSATFRLIQTDVLANKHTLDPTVVDALGNTDFAMVANLPYQVATPLLLNLVVDHPTMHRAVIMIQREVADRIVADPGGKEYGILPVIAQAAMAVQIVTTLPPDCFWPKPKVSSAVIALERLAQPKTDQLPRLARLARRLFSQRRKQIGSLLGRQIDWPEGIDPSARPEQLSVEQFIELMSRVPDTEK
jgi:16S rRNA (adenine1518-N6/adenine1519-N6)-dimethyltransferase